MLNEGSQKCMGSQWQIGSGWLHQRLYIYPNKYCHSKAKCDVRQAQHRDCSHYIGNPTNSLVLYLKAVEGESQITH